MGFIGAKAAKPSRNVARTLLNSAVRQGRAPAFYERMGAPDTVEGRFELLTLHVVILIDRLAGEGADTLGQALFDAFVGDLDGALREMGVGDLAMGKRMRALGAVFYGRAAAYREAFAAFPDVEPLREVLRRVLFKEDVGDAAALATYAARTRGALAGQSLEDLARGEPRWPTP
ncbi:MAG: ubiquinol-cytochrome C chaperone family protein [Caulobacteraceae bacterium]